MGCQGNLSHIRTMYRILDAVLLSVGDGLMRERYGHALFLQITRPST